MEVENFPRLQTIANCVKVRENYKLCGKIYHIWFDPRKEGWIVLAREKVKEGSRLVSRLYYNKEDKIILTEMF